MAAQIVALTMAVSSCGLYEIGEVETDMLDGGIWGGPSDSADKTPDVVRRICYMTAFDYQKDYDWRADRSRESVKCSLIVYEDGRAIMKVPVGEAYEVSPDPDMHRIIGGHLYTDYSNTVETVIKCDGRQLFRYPGCEYICGMELIGDDLYSLGQSRYGNGFALRKNGEMVLTMRDDCRPFDPKERSQYLNSDDPSANIGLRMIMRIAREVSYSSAMKMNNLIIRI